MLEAPIQTAIIPAAGATSARRAPRDATLTNSRNRGSS